MTPDSPNKSDTRFKVLRILRRLSFISIYPQEFVARCQNVDLFLTDTLYRSKKIVSHKS